MARLQAEAAGPAKVPVRFVLVVEGNGCPPGQLHPQGMPEHMAKVERREKFKALSLEGHELSPAMSPLAGYESRVNIIQGLSGRICGGGHSNNFGALGAYGARGASHDQQLL